MKGFCLKKALDPSEQQVVKQCAVDLGTPLSRRCGEISNQGQTSLGHLNFSGDFVIQAWPCEDDRPLYWDVFH